MTNTPGPDWLPTEWLRLVPDRPPGETPRNVILRKWVRHDGAVEWFPFEPVVSTSCTQRLTHE